MSTETNTRTAAASHTAPASRTWAPRGHGASSTRASSRARRWVDRTTGSGWAWETTMHARARVGARRRWAVVATALVTVGLSAPAAVAQVGVRPHQPRTKPIARTGLLVSVCRFSHRSNDDPIVYPGQPGAAHT